jgi:hypothetical protein
MEALLSCLLGYALIASRDNSAVSNRAASTTLPFNITDAAPYVCQRASVDSEYEEDSGERCVCGIGFEARFCRRSCMRSAKAAGHVSFFI